MEKGIRIILEDFRGEESIASLCRREGIAESLYYNWSKEFLEAGKGALPVTQPARRPAREVKMLRAEARALKDALAEIDAGEPSAQKHDRGY